MRQLGLPQPIISYSAIYNPKLIQQLGPGGRGRDRDLARARRADEPEGKGLCGALEKEVGREPNGLPYTQYLYDAPYLVADGLQVARRQETRRSPGENFPQGDAGDQDLRPSRSPERPDQRDHTVVKPVYLMEVKDGKWTRKAIVERDIARRRASGAAAPGSRERCDMLDLDHHPADPLDVARDLQLLRALRRRLRAGAEGQRDCSTSPRPRS